MDQSSSCARGWRGGEEMSNVQMLEARDLVMCVWCSGELWTTVQLVSPRHVRMDRTGGDLSGRVRGGVSQK